MLAGLVGGGGGKSSPVSSSTSSTVSFGSPTYAMPTATPVSSATGSNTLLIVAGAGLAVLVVVLLLRK